MSASTSKGRKSYQSYIDTLADRSAEQGMLVKMDEMIDILIALTAKLDADAGITDTDYASTLTDSLEKVSLRD